MAAAWNRNALRRLKCKARLETMGENSMLQIPDPAEQMPRAKPVDVPNHLFIRIAEGYTHPAPWLIPVDSIKGRYTVKILLQRPRLHIYNSRQAKHIAHA